MRIVVICILFFLPSQLSAQVGNGSTYPKGYFRNPLDIPILLAGNFGECRIGHFHSGIDIKTNGRENLAVHAAAAGYISRIKMEKGGFGHALYITHPNGFTTLYAHLNSYTTALQQYLKKTQYEKQSWAVDIALKPGQFVVKKGEVIAWSGNTGASTAPHLHFEIRNTESEHPLNPLLFGLPLKDTRPPVPLRLAVYNAGTSIYMQTPRFASLKKTASDYRTDTLLLGSAETGIAIQANDFMDGSDNTLNFYTAHWYMDDSLQGSICLDDIGYEETRYLHAYADYKTMEEDHGWYQLLFRLPGNALTHIYPWLNPKKGTFVRKDNLPHLVSIILRDAQGNAAKISLFVKYTGGETKVACDRVFEANAANSFEDPNLRFTLNEKDLYDDACFHLERMPDSGGYSDRYGVLDATIPVHQYYELFIKPNKLVPFDLRKKMILMYSDGKKESGRSAKQENGWYKAKVRDFGRFWLSADTTAPVIKALQKEGADLAKATRLSFSVIEEQTSVKTFRAELDGNWLAFEPRGGVFFYTFDEHCPKGRHKLVIQASDENDNQQTLVFNFTR